MGFGGKIVTGAGIAGATAAGIFGVRLYRLSRLLEITHRIKVSKLSLSAMTLTVDVVIKNPSAGSLTLRYPFLRVMLGDKELATSQVVDSDITLKPYSTTEINNITFTLSVVQELSLLSSLLTPLLTGQSVKIRAITQTGARFLFFHIPFSMEEDVMLNQAGSGS